MGVPRSSASAPVVALAALFCVSGMDAQGGATIAGIVSTTVPVPPAVRVTTDVPICGNSLPDESIVTGDDGAVANAVVIVEGLKAAARPSTIEITNAGCRFVPHVVVAPPRATVRLTSKDQALHTVHAQHQAKSIFNVGLPIPGLTLSRTLPAAGVVKLGCNTHSWMSGYAYITTERAVVTGSDGRFAIADVPPGTYTVRVWHETLKEQRQKVTVAAGAPALRFALTP